MALQAARYKKWRRLGDDADVMFLDYLLELVRLVRLVRWKDVDGFEHASW